jgi:hypothetical protein
VRGDHQAAVDDPHQGTAATGPVHVAGELSCPQVGVGPFSGAACAEGRGQIWRDEAHRAPANRRATVIMVCREAWSAIGVVEPRGFRWIGRSACPDSHVWDAW